MPICAGDPIPESKKLNYGKFALLKTTISIKKLIELVAQLPQDKSIDIKFDDIDIKFNGRSLGAYYKCNSGTGWINIDWGFEKYQYSTNYGGYSGPLVAVDLPLYTDYRSVIREFIGLDTDRYSDAQGIIFCLPNYGARIREINVSTTMLKVSIDTKTETASGIIGKLSYIRDKETVKKDVIFSDNEASNIVDLEFEPQQFHIMLLSRKSGDILDERWFGFGWNLPKDVRIDIPDHELSELINEGEKQTVEFKEKLSNSHAEFVETVVAFANTQGGVIVFGINDETHIVGFYEKGNYKDTITKIISSNCEPPIVYEFEDRILKEKPLLLVKVMEGRDKPYVFRGKGPYVRVNGTDRIATRFEMDGFYRQKNR
jgi:hypothetical protein